MATICLCDQNPELVTLRATTSFPIWSCSGRGLPCSENYFYTRWSLTPPFHPYLCEQRRFAFCCAILPGNLLSGIPLLEGLPALWSPDFPHILPLNKMRGRRCQLSQYYTSLYQKNNKKLKKSFSASFKQKTGLATCSCCAILLV